MIEFDCHSKSSYLRLTLDVAISSKFMILFKNILPALLLPVPIDNFYRLADKIWVWIYEFTGKKSYFLSAYSLYAGDDN